jgi:hypothetical protein
VAREQERGIDRYYRQVREIRDELGISHDEARQRWGEFYAPGGTPIRPVRKLKPVEKAKLIVRAATTANGSCPLCRDVVQSDGADPIHTCSSCQTKYHRECIEELGEQCATLGCVARRVVRRARVAFAMPQAPTTPVAVRDTRADHTPLPQPEVWFTVRQDGTEPMSFATEADAHRMAAQIIGNGRTVRITRDDQPHLTISTSSTDEQMEEVALQEIEQAPKRRGILMRLAAILEFFYDALGPALIPIAVIVVFVIVKLLTLIASAA